MKKKFFAYMIIGILLFTFLAQGKETKTYWFQIASQGEGESGFLTNSNLNQKKVYLPLMTDHPIIRHRFLIF